MPATFLGACPLPSRCILQQLHEVLFLGALCPWEKWDLRRSPCPKSQRKRLTLADPCWALSRGWAEPAPSSTLRLPLEPCFLPPTGSPKQGSICPAGWVQQRPRCCSPGRSPILAGAPSPVSSFQGLISGIFKKWLQAADFQGCVWFKHHKGILVGFTAPIGL